ncbi:MAG: hypothetical protein RL607_1463 [Bacteroidota bacterium]|jgi:hypothetical protein
MKKTIALFFLATSTFFQSCDTNDDDFYNTEYVRVNNLIQVETQSVYHVGDKLFINCEADRLVSEVGQTNPLDIRKTTNNAPSLSFSYILEKQTSPTEWATVSVPNNQIDLTAGSIESVGFYMATANYNGLTDSYQFRAGIPLLSAGTYKLSYGYNSSATDIIELRSNSVSSAITLMIYTTSNAVNSEGNYIFTVN